MLSIGALPVYAWLDGTNEGEADARALLEFMAAAGAVAVNIIPERNWNLSNPDEKRLKTAKLKEVIETAEALDLPLLAGTEMNKAGQPFVDRFDAPELNPWREAFLKGARFVYGHTLLSRAAGCGYHSAFARSAFSSRRRKNEFYIRAGSGGPPSAAGMERIRKAAERGDPEAIIMAIGSQ